MVEGKEEEQNRYKKDLALAFNSLISYQELVNKGQNARSE